MKLPQALRQGLPRNGGPNCQLQCDKKAELHASLSLECIRPKRCLKDLRFASRSLQSEPSLWISFESWEKSAQVPIRQFDETTICLTGTRCLGSHQKYVCVLPGLGSSKPETFMADCKPSYENPFAVQAGSPESHK